MKPAHLVWLLVMNAFWSTVYSAYKVLGAQHISSGNIVTLRFGLAGLVLLLLWPWLPGKAPRGRDLVKTCIIGLMLYVVGQRLQVFGNQIGTAGNSAVLIALEPLMTSVAAALFLHEKIGPRRFTGFILGMAGVAVLNGAGRADFQWAGLKASLIFISSFVCEAAYSVTGKTIVERSGVMKMLAISLLVGLVVNLAIDGASTVRAAATLSPAAWGLLLMLSLICTVLAYSVWFLVVRECPVNIAALTIFAQSIFGILIAALWIKEKLHWGHLFGSVTIIAGLALGLSRQVKNDPATAHSATTPRRSQ